MEQRVPLSSSISNRSQDEYRIDAARTSSRRSGFTLEGVTGGEGERETKREREREREGSILGFL